MWVLIIIIFNWLRNASINTFCNYCNNTHSKAFTGFTDAALQSAIVAAGGVVAASLTKAVTVVVCKDVNSQSAKIQQVVARGGSVVSKDALTQQLAGGAPVAVVATAAVAASAGATVISTPAKKSKKVAASAATVSASPAAAAAAVPQAAPAQAHPTGVIDPISGLQSKGHILSEGAEVYDVDLALQDAAKNANKFYHLQVVESHNRSEYWLVQHWGRIGTKGQCKLEGPTTKAEAIAGLKKKYKEKAGVAFDTRHSTGSVQGKYTAVELKAHAAGKERGDVCG